MHGLAYLCLFMMLLKTSTCYPQGSPGCDYDPSHYDANGRQIPPQSKDVPHNIIFDKTRNEDGSFLLTIQGNIKCPLESVYVEDSFVGFSVKTTHRGQFVATEGVKVLKCDGKFLKLFRIQNLT